MQGETLLGACIPEKKDLFLRWRIEITAGFADNERVMKIQLSNPLLREFFEQLRFVSKEQEQKVLDAAESLLMVIDPDREYPYDFVVFRLSGVRPRSDDLGQTIPGRQILADLRVWLTMKTASIAIPAPPQAEGIYTIEQLAAACSVSTKTIRRWQRRGLVGRMYVFADGKKRLGFSASMVEQFKATHGALIQQAQHFRQLSSSVLRGRREVCAHSSSARNGDSFTSPTLKKCSRCTGKRVSIFWACFRMRVRKLMRATGSK